MPSTTCWVSWPASSRTRQVRNSSRRSIEAKASAAPLQQVGDSPSIWKLLMPFSMAAKIRARHSLARRRDCRTGEA
jgi:hypothetical protein